MAIAYNPSIADNGQVLYLDAANPKSAVGATWNDLSGKGNTGTRFGAVPYSTDGGGSFDFATNTGPNTFSSSLGFTFASNMIPTTGGFTLSCWVKNPTPGRNLFGNAGGADGYRLAIQSAATYAAVGQTGGGWREIAINFLSPLSTSLWYNVAMVYDRAGQIDPGTPKFILYLNGVLQGSTTMAVDHDASIPFTNTAPGLVRCPPSDTELYRGKIATFSAHNRVLLAGEIQQNFIALRGRFGV
jgi:hypothetical protein